MLKVVKKIVLVLAKIAFALLWLMCFCNVTPFDL